MPNVRESEALCSLISGYVKKKILQLPWAFPRGEDGWPNPGPSLFFFPGVPDDKHKIELRWMQKMSGREQILQRTANIIILLAPCSMCLGRNKIATVKLPATFSLWLYAC